jgi:hypothetical protein
MGYAGKIAKEFSARFSLALAVLEHKPTVLALRSAELFMRASLSWFLIFCKTLSSSLFRSPVQRQGAPESQCWAISLP